MYLFRQRQNTTLSTSTDRTADVTKRCYLITSRQHKCLQRREQAVQTVDLRLHLFHLFGGNDTGCPEFCFSLSVAR